MKLDGTKKILLLGLILIIIAGIVVVALKGFNVSLMNEQHESINVVIGKEVSLVEIKDICEEVFVGKEVIVKNLEVFEDAVNINVESITDEEKQQLVEKINNKYNTELTVDSITVESIANIRLRDIIRPYIIPMAISIVLIVAYMIVRFRRSKLVVFLGKLFGIIVLSELLIASIISIVRIPVSPILINVLFALAILEIVLYIDFQEKGVNVKNKKGAEK